MKEVWRTEYSRECLLTSQASGVFLKLTEFLLYVSHPHTLVSVSMLYFETAKKCLERLPLKVCKPF